MRGTDRDVHELVCRRYLAQFYPAHDYLQTRLELDLAGERFTASGRQLLALGWKQLGAAAPCDDDPASASEDASASPLPRLAPGERLTAAEVSVLDKRTQPPKAFTDASLIGAMCSIAKVVHNPQIKKILSDADGIGTPATRAAIIETLFTRAYIRREKKAIVSTPTGRALIDSLPEVATTPDMTAVWEAAMRSITEGQQSLDAFLARVTAQLRQLVDQGRALGHIIVTEARKCTKPGCTGYMRRLKGPRGPFLSCRVCRSTAEDPALPSKTHGPVQAARHAPEAPAQGKTRTSTTRPRPNT